MQDIFGYVKILENKLTQMAAPVIQDRQKSSKNYSRYLFLVLFFEKIFNLNFPTKYWHDLLILITSISSLLLSHKIILQYIQKKFLANFKRSRGSHFFAFQQHYKEESFARAVGILKFLVGTYTWWAY